jgi:para-aminobenzoate synthetase / 4-amino-4-deoxychorismate lyase
VGSGSAFRLVCEPLDWEMPAVDALRLVRGDAHPAALLGAWAGGSDIVCSEPTVSCCEPEPPWAALDTAWPATAAGGDRPRFGGGWIGYLGFGLAGHVLPVPPAPGGPRRLPSWWLGYYDHVLRRDRSSGQWFFEALHTPERAGALAARLAELRARARAARPQPPAYACGEFRLTPSAAEHRAAVRRAVEYVRQGDIFQANICLRLEAGFSGDPLDAFCAAASRLDPPYAAFVGLGDGAVASLSPELFLRRAGTAVTSSPVKGTLARPDEARRAAVQRDRLDRSAKNRAENVMIVDLVRSDLSRVCEPGSVRVPRLAAAEPHPGVWHLVSEVTGQLRPGTGDGDVIRAAFPPGSVTGAPKVRALEVIHELEATPREAYTGAVGYRSPAAGLELNVAIRTFEFHSGRVWLGAGGGITAASNAADEYRECLLKAAPLISALGGHIAEAAPAGPGARRRSPDPGLSLRPRPAGHHGSPELGSSLRPRPAAGIFTSLAVRDGRARLGDHLDRLDASARQLFGKGLPPGLDAELAACLAGRPSGRLRITVRPLGGPLHATVEVVPLGPPAGAADLVPVTVPGGIGAHKWRDRRLLAQLARAAGAGPATHLLIEDADGQVLETDRASVFAVTTGVLRTPPADGRLLPGITRAAVLRLAAAAGLPAEPVPLTRHDLMTASEAFLVNSVVGVLPVRSVAGTILPAAPGPVTRMLAAALAAEPAPRADPDGTAGADRRPAELAGFARELASRAGSAAQRPPSRSQGRGRPASVSVIVIDNYDSFTYNLVHQLAQAGCAVEVVRNDEVTAAQVAAAGPAGVVISPGPCAPADAGISVEVVRACAPAIPVLGICLGHQAIAAAFGAAIIAAPRPVHGRASAIVHDGRGVLAGLPQRFRAARYHSLAVDERTLPPSLLVSARTRAGLPMGVRHTTLTVEGLQFHPESILTAHGQAIMTAFARTLAGRGSPPSDTAGRVS